MNTANGITYHEFNLPLEPLGPALRMATGEAVRILLDGRSANRFAEQWNADDFKFVKIGGANRASCVRCPATGKRYIVRTLTRNGIKFQESKLVGTQRHCTDEELKASIEAVDGFLVSDLRRFPQVSTYLVPSATLLGWQRDGQLTPRGLKPDAFHALLNRTMKS